MQHQPITIMNFSICAILTHATFETATSQLSRINLGLFPGLE